jgi:hypothetical protein
MSYYSKSSPSTGRNKPIGFQEAEVPRFLETRHTKGERSSALRTGRLSTLLQPTKALRESRDIAQLCFLDLGTRKVWGVSVTPRSLTTPWKDQVPIYRRLGGPQGRSGQVRKISPPPEFDPRTVQPARPPLSKEIFLVYISIRGWVGFRSIVRPEGLCKWKIPMTPPGFKPATFRLLPPLRARCCTTVGNLMEHIQ